jgi:putative colanic acid biosynthesis acetyltransferase WcaF
MSEPLQAVDPGQASQFASPWSINERILRGLWEFCWAVFCVWTPKPANPWRLFWLGVFEARIHGTPFVHQRARIAIPWKITLHDRACVGDRANLYSLGEIELGARCIIAQEAYLCTGTHDFSQASFPLVVAKITVGEDAFVGARTFVMPGVTIGARAIVGACSVVTKDVPESVIAAGNPCKVHRLRPSVSSKGPTKVREESAGE